jgi:hypothetical protein
VRGGEKLVWDLCEPQIAKIEKKKSQGRRFFFHFSRSEKNLLTEFSLTAPSSKVARHTADFVGAGAHNHKCHVVLI